MALLDRPHVFLDTETATLRGAPHLLELAAVRVVDGEVQESFSELVLPAVPIDPAASEYHGLTEEDVRDAPFAPDVLARFARWAGADTLVAHDARADLHVLAFEYARAELEAPAGLVIDTLAMARHAFPGAPDHRLETLAQHLELEVQAEHRALPDAIACWQLFEACLEIVGDGEDARLDLLRRGRRSENLRTAGPRLPRRRPALVRRLEAARRAGRPVRLAYGAPTAAPATLDVLPRLLYQTRDHAYLEGECQHSGELKTYRLDRIQRVGDPPR